MIEQTQVTRRGLAAWSTRDLLIAVALSLALGIASFGITAGWTLLFAVVGPFVAVALSGYVVLLTFVVPYVLRKPGAALLGQVIGSLAQVPFSPFGLLVLVAGLIFGVVGEAPFLFTRYRVYNLRFLVIAGGLVNLVALLLALPANAQYAALPIGGQVALCGVSIISGAIFGGLTVPLCQTLARSGVLNNTPLGQTLDDQP